MRVLLPLLATVMLAACTGSDGTGSSSPGPFPASERGVGDSLASRLQEALDDSLARTDIPGAQAAVILPDGRAWSGGSGLSDVDSERPVTPHTQFAIGSITKTFTAALVLRIAEDGLLSIDDPLTKWTPRFPDADGVTVRQLMDHTSGLASLAPSDIVDVLHREPNHRFTDAEVFLPPACDPGACYQYQSPDYALLGRIAERATGHSLASAYREVLFDPLGLRESYFPSQEPVRGEVATGYGRDALTTGPADETASGTWIAPTSLPPAGGGLVSTAADVARFGAALFGGAHLSARTLAQMLDFEATVGLPGTDECGAYGLGVVRSSALGRETWGHGGSTGNFHTILEYFPRESVAVAVLVNSGSDGLGSITDEIARVALQNSAVLHTDLGGGYCNYDIYAIRTDGSGLTRLTTDPATDGTPVAWSPDGSRIAFGSDRDGNAEIYVMSADGSNQVNVTNAPSGDFGASWSPDGSQIAFFSDRSGPTRSTSWTPTARISAGSPGTRRTTSCRRGRRTARRSRTRAASGRATTSGS
jgi:D-alanyl-D-alanine carboxypeptidase